MLLLYRHLSIYACGVAHWLACLAYVAVHAWLLRSIHHMVSGIYNYIRRTYHMKFYAYLHNLCPIMIDNLTTCYTISGR